MALSKTDEAGTESIHKAFHIPLQDIPLQLCQCYSNISHYGLPTDSYIGE